jgi:prepilin-type N-terminal cleavage/methylation domain-containing protein
MKKAFTLSEMLVCLALISVITALFMSVIRVRPNVNMVMLRKAYNTTSNIVYEMLQTATYYPNGTLSDLDATSQKVDNEKPSGTTKFCKIFVSFLNTADEANCSTKKEPNFSTLDGITWYIPPSSFPTSGNTIKVDVNGIKNLPNCKEGEEGCKTPDTFEFTILPSGKIKINSEIAKEYLQNTKRVSK